MDLSDVEKELAFLREENARLRRVADEAIQMATEARTLARQTREAIECLQMTPCSCKRLF